MSLPRLTVLIPCYNESACVREFEPRLWPSLDRLGVDYEVLAVDDGSIDATAAALSEQAGRFPRLRALRHEANRGLGAALRTGLREARGEFLVFLDADLSFHPDLIALLLAKQRETDADCVSGSPYLSPETDVPWRRRLPSLVLNAAYRGLFEPRLSAYTPMFRLYRTRALARLDLKSDGFDISVEILVKLLRAGARVVEIPTPLSTRRAGASKLRPLRELKNHARLAWRLLFADRGGPAIYP